MKEIYKKFLKNIIIWMTLVLSIFTIDKIIVDNKPRFDIEKYDNEVREYMLRKCFNQHFLKYIFPQVSKCDLVEIGNGKYEIVCNGMNFTRVYRYIGSEGE